MKAFKKEELKALQARIHRIERPKERSAGVLGLGAGAIDDALPEGGLSKAAVHEVMGSAASGFAAMLVGRTKKTALWCVEAGLKTALYGPGLAAYGVATERLVIVHCRGADEMLWAMEEGLREEALGLVIGEPVRPVSLIASRRLQLAAETGGTMGLILCRGGGTCGTGGKGDTHDGEGVDGREGVLAPSAVSTRWQVDSVPAMGQAASRPWMQAATKWQLALRRCRGADHTNSWTVEWDDAARDIALVTDVCHRGLVSPPEHCLAG
jgi:protein ImuA